MSFRRGGAIPKTTMGSGSGDCRGKETSVPPVEGRNTVEGMKWKIKEYELLMAEQSRRLEEKQNDIEQLRGRLEESRNSRDVTLRDMKLSHQEYITKIQKLSVQFDQAQQQLIKLNNDRELNSAEFRNAEDITKKLEESLQNNEGLTRKVQILESTNAQLNSKVSMLKKRMGEMENYLQTSNHEKVQYQNLLRQSMDKKETDRNKENTLKEQYYEEQIRKLSSENSALKTSLDETRATTNQLSKELGNEKKEHGLCKVDVRILKREKKILEDRVELYDDSRRQIEEDHQKCSQVIEELKKKLDEAERSTSLYKTESEHSKYQLTHSEKRREELQAEKVKNLSHVTELKSEITNLRNRLELLDSLKCQVTETDSLMRRKQKEIDEKDIQIKELRTNVGKLKEAATYLDSQLRDFDAELLSSREEFKKSENKRLMLEGELQTARESLRQAKSECNEAKSYKMMLLKKVENADSAAQEMRAESSSKIQALEDQLNAKSEACVELENRIAQLIDDIDKVKEEKQMTEYVLASTRGANEGLSGEVKNILDNFVRSKNDVVNLKNELLTCKVALSDAIQKAETYKSLYDKWSEAYDTLEKESSNTELQYRTQCDQLNKLVTHLKEDNDKLSKKKSFRFFKFGPEKSVPVSPMVGRSTEATPRKAASNQTPRRTEISSTPQRALPPFKRIENTLPRLDTGEPSISSVKTPGLKSENKSTPMKLIKEHQAVKNLEGQAANLKQKLAVLQDKTESGLTKSVLFKDNSFDVNCSYLVEDNLYLLGCGEGLFSVKPKSPNYRGKVRIDGVSSIHHIESVDALRLVLMIEGSARRLIGVHKGMLKVAAQAATCSQPSIDIVEISDVKDISLISHRTFRGELSSSEVCLCVATHRHLHLLAWSGEHFVPVKKINVRENITCLLITPLTVIFGSDNMWQLDLKNFELEEFIDRTDTTMYYLHFSCETQATYPLAIVDIGRIDPATTDEDEQEYLLCFSELGVFVDSEGRRTRQEDVVWTKAPKSIIYRAPNLYILHFTSVEIINISRDSYTRRRMTTTGEMNNVQPIIPKSRYLNLESPRLLGFGSQPGSIVVSSSEKATTEIIEIDLDPREAL